MTLSQSNVSIWEILERLHVDQGWDVDIDGHRFTLTEMMIVIAVFAIVAAIAVPSFMSLLPGMRLNGAARQIMGDLMAARMDAVKQNNQMRVFFNSPGTNQYQILDDDDNDGILDDANPRDNCPKVTNANQVDTDGDGIGDACDDDDDNDGVPDDEDNCDMDYNPNQENTPGYTEDNTGDSCDDDLDNDGFANAEDYCPNVASTTNSDIDGDGIPGIGRGDGCDNCPEISNSDQADADQNGRGDECDG